MTIQTIPIPIDLFEKMTALLREAQEATYRAIDDGVDIGNMRRWLEQVEQATNQAAKHLALHAWKT